MYVLYLFSNKNVLFEPWDVRGTENGRREEARPSSIIIGRKRGECEEILVREQYGLSFRGKKTTAVQSRSLERTKATGPRKLDDVVSDFATTSRQYDIAVIAPLIFCKSVNARKSFEPIVLTIGFR